MSCKSANNALQGIRYALAYPDVPNDIGWTHGVSYQIQQQGFYDSPKGNTKCEKYYRFGNINGIIQKLDYLEDLGIESLYITQPTLGHSYFGFDVINPELIDPKTGTNEDFAKLIKESHCRGIKVIMGIVYHQTSTYHPFFQKALEGKKKYMDLYYFGVDKPFIYNDIGNSLWVLVKDYFPDTVLGRDPRNLYFRSKFWTDISPVADTNLENPRMIKYVLNFCKYWIDLGIDGFRVDVDSESQITEFISNTVRLNGVDPNGHINRIIIKALREMKADLVLYAEAINNYVHQFDSGKSFGAANDYYLYSLFANLVNGYTTPDAVLQEYLNSILPEAKKYSDVVFLENHDFFPRFITYITGRNTPVIVTLDQPPKYTPAVTGTFNIHWDLSTLTPAFQNNNLNLYYFGNGFASNPFPAGSVNNLDPTGSGPYFLGGGNDDFGPYWTFSIEALSLFNGDTAYFGFISILRDPLIKIGNDNLVTKAMGDQILANKKGDVFVSGLGIPTTLPTQDELNQVQTYYGAIFAWPGTPQIFQGQEFGMQGVGDPSNREPLIWSEEGCQVKGFAPYFLPDGVAPKGYENVYSTPFTVRPPGHHNSLWEYVRKAIRVRKYSPTLKYGPMIRLSLPGDPNINQVVIFDQGKATVTQSEMIAFTRVLSEWPIYCLFNFGGSTKTVEYRSGNQDNFCSVAWGSPQILYSHNITTSGPADYCDPFVITMAPFSSVVFTPVEDAFLPDDPANNSICGRCNADNVTNKVNTVSAGVKSTMRNRIMQKEKAPLH